MRGPCRVQVRLPGWAPSVTATEEAASDTEAGGLARRARSIPDLSSACWAGAGWVRTERASGVQASRRASDRCTWQGAGRGRGDGSDSLAGKHLLSPLKAEWFCSFFKENPNQHPKSPMFRTPRIGCYGTQGSHQVPTGLVWLRAGHRCSANKTPPEPLLALPHTERRQAPTLLSVTCRVPLATPRAGPVTSILALQVHSVGVLAKGARLPGRAQRPTQTRGAKPIGQFGGVNQKALRDSPTKHKVPPSMAPRKQGCVPPSPPEHPPRALQARSRHLSSNLCLKSRTQPSRHASPARHHRSSRDSRPRQKMNPRREVRNVPFPRNLSEAHF